MTHWRVKRIHLGWLAVICMALATFAGCGKKAPPTAPDQPPMVAVTDLNGRLEQGAVTLNWHHEPNNSKAVGYVLFRAQSPAAQPDCPDCPLVFQKIHTLSLDKTARKQRRLLEFRQTIPAGRYTYKLRPMQTSGAQGPDSNFAVIAVPQEN